MPYSPRSPQDQVQLLNTTGSKFFGQPYIDSVFNAWWQAGKPGPKELLRIISPVPGTTVLPSVSTLTGMITSIFNPRAEALDAELMQTVKEQAVALRVEMLNRHIALGKKAQDIAMEWLEQRKDDLNGNSAVRLLVEGVRIERESAGISEAIEKVTQMSDNDLLRELESIITKSPGRLEPGDISSPD